MMNNDKFSGHIDLEKIWKDDFLGRREDADWLAVFLRNRSIEMARQEELRSYVLNLDAQWGSGKTFFLTRLKDQLDISGHIAVYVNAWRDDFADDPLLAVMAAIDETVEKHRGLTLDAKDKWNAVKEKTGQIARIAGKGLLKRGLGFIITESAVDVAEGVLSNIDTSSPEIKTKTLGGTTATANAVTEGINHLIDSQIDKSVSNFRTQQHLIQDFRDKLADFVFAVENIQGKKKPFFVLVDELDRCRPPYAIAMLERIKHLFETPGVVFVVATDSRQLSHSIKAVYGAEFESARYLRRFFDQTYEFDSPSLEGFIAYLMDRNPIDLHKLSSPFKDEHALFLANFFISTSTDLRTVEQIYKHLHSMISAWEEPSPIELAVALPLIMAFAHRQPISNMKDAIKKYVPSNWLITWKEYDNRSFGRSVLKHEAVKTVTDDLLTRIEKPLHILASEPKGGSRPRQWVDEIILKEFRQRVGGSVSPQDPDIFSLIGSYPKRISQAGRIKSEVSTSK